MFWRFAKEPMRSRLLRPRTVKRAKKEWRACVSHSIESHKCAERAGDPPLLFLPLIKESFRRSRATQWIRINRPRRQVPERFLGCESCSYTYNRIGSGKTFRLCRFILPQTPPNWLEQGCRNKGSLDVFPMKRIDRHHNFRGVFCPVLGGQRGLFATVLLADC